MSGPQADAQLPAAACAPCVQVLISAVPDDVTFKRMRQVLGLVPSGGFNLREFHESPASRIVDLAFGELEPQYCQYVPGAARATVQPRGVGASVVHWCLCLCPSTCMSAAAFTAELSLRNDIPQPYY